METQIKIAQQTGADNELFTEPTQNPVGMKK